MGKNKGKGGKSHKRAKSSRTTDAPNRELMFKTDGQEYAVVNKSLGECRFSVQCGDGLNRLGLVRGNMRKKVWIQPGNTVIVCLRDFQDSKCDIVHKFTGSEVRKLRALGELNVLLQASDASGGVSSSHVTEMGTLGESSTADVNGTTEIKECGFDFNEI